MDHQRHSCLAPDVWQQLQQFVRLASAGLSALLVTLAWGCGDAAAVRPDAITTDSASDTADAPVANIHPLQRKPDGSACPPGHAWHDQQGCVAVGPPECANALLERPESCQPRWCASWQTLGQQPCAPGSVGCNPVARACTPAELQAGQGCVPGTWPDPLYDGKCVPAGWLGAAPLPAVASAADLDHLPREVPRWCFDWRDPVTSQACNGADWQCWPIGRACTAAERSSGAGCLAGWWPHPAYDRQCVPAGWLGAESEPPPSELAHATESQDADADLLPPAEAPQWCGGPTAPRPCRHAEAAAGAGCRSGWWPDPLRGGACAPAGWPAWAPLPAALDADAAPPSPDAPAEWCADWLTDAGQACQAGAEACWPQPRSCTAAEAAPQSKARWLAGAAMLCPTGFAITEDGTCGPDPASCDLAQWATQVSASAPGVLFVAAGGDDSQAGTAEQPLATLGKALAAAKPGSTIALGPGSWTATASATLPLNAAGKVALDQPTLTLRGVCPALTELRWAPSVPAGSKLRMQALRWHQPKTLDPTKAQAPASVQVAGSLQLREVALQGEAAPPTLQGQALPLVEVLEGGGLDAADVTLASAPGAPLIRALGGQVLLRRAAGGETDATGWLQAEGGQMWASQLRVGPATQGSLAALDLRAGAIAQIGAVDQGAGTRLLDLRGGGTSVVLGGLASTSAVQVAALADGAALTVHGSRIQGTAEPVFLLAGQAPQLRVQDTLLRDLAQSAVKTAFVDSPEPSPPTLVQFNRSSITGYGQRALDLHGNQLHVDLLATWIGGGGLAQQLPAGAVVASGASLLQMTGCSLVDSVDHAVWTNGVASMHGLRVNGVHAAGPDFAGSGVAIRLGSSHTWLTTAHLSDIDCAAIKADGNGQHRLDTLLLQDVGKDGHSGTGLEVVAGALWVQNLRAQGVGDRLIRSLGLPQLRWHALGVQVNSVHTGVDAYRGLDWRLDGSALHNVLQGLYAHCDFCWAAGVFSTGTSHGLQVTGRGGPGASHAVQVRWGAQLAMHAAHLRRASVSGVLVEAVEDGARQLGRRTWLDLQDALIEDTLPDAKTSEGGGGVYVNNQGELSMRRVRIRGGFTGGVLARWGGRISGAGVRIEGVREDQLWASFGGGLVVIDSEAVLAGLVVRDCQMGGALFSGPLGVADVGGASFAQIAPTGPLNNFGFGIAVNDAGKLRLVQSEVHEVHASGVVINAASAEVRGVVVQRVKPSDFVKPGGDAIPLADALLVTASPHALLSHNVLIDLPRAGILLDQGSDLTVRQNYATRNTFGLVQQSGVQSALHGNAFFANQQNQVLQGQLLPLPPPPVSVLGLP